MKLPDLATTYLGLRLESPFMIGASPLADTLDAARRLEDAGCGALVLHSLFEEQISEADTGRIHQMDRLDPEFVKILSDFPAASAYASDPDKYLEHVRKLKAAVKIPVIASLNGNSAERWLRFGSLLEEAGADAVEVNLYAVVTDAKQSPVAVER